MMKIRRSRTPTEADLAALADGSLPASRRIRVERAVSESPRLQQAVAAQRRALGAIDRMSDQAAPMALRARLALAHPPSPAETRLGPVRLVAASLTAVAAAVVVVVIATGGSRSPTVVQASLLAARAPLTSVGKPIGHSQALPGVTEDGLTYPYLEDQFGYRAVGVRYDRLAGRTVTTVVYTRGSARAAYEIVSGAPLKLGRTGWTVKRHGVQFWMLHAGSRSVVTWIRDGHSCVLVGQGTAVPVMLRLASWHQGGRVPY